MRIPQTDPRAGYAACKSAIDSAVHRVMDSGRYILGREVAAFESEFAAYLGVPHCVAVGSGTDALWLALQAGGVGRDDEVIVPSHTAVATITAVVRTGAIPVFVDIDPETYVMDAGRLPAALTNRTKAIVPVHLYGLPADMQAVSAFAGAHDLRVIEDCAQAHGADCAAGDRCPATSDPTAEGRRKVGTFGDAAAFSFYPTKNLGALGDAGCVVTGDQATAEQLRLLRQYGWRERYISDEMGWNSRMDELQAAILRQKLCLLDADNERRRRIAAIYSEAFETTAMEIPMSPPGRRHVYHQYVIQVPQRDVLRERLSRRGVGTAIHYPVPVHHQPAYARFAPPAGLPVTESVCREILSLPMYPQLDESDACFVTESVIAAIRQP